MRHKKPASNEKKERGKKAQKHKPHNIDVTHVHLRRDNERRHPPWVRDPIPDAAVIPYQLTGEPTFPGIDTDVIPEEPRQIKRPVVLNGEDHVVLLGLEHEALGEHLGDLNLIFRATCAPKKRKRRWR